VNSEKILDRVWFPGYMTDKSSLKIKTRSKKQGTKSRRQKARTSYFSPLTFYFLFYHEAAGE
jgi:hypothetical protein